MGTSSTRAPPAAAPPGHLPESASRVCRASPRCRRPQVAPPLTSTGTASLPGLGCPTCPGGVDGADPWRPSSWTIGLSRIERACPLTRLRPSSPKGAAPRRSALTRLTLQRHHGYQVVSDVKKGEHRHARKGKGQFIPRRGHDNDLPRRPSSRGDGFPAHAVKVGGGALAGAFFCAASRSLARAPWHPRRARRGGAVSPRSHWRVVGGWAG